MRSREDVVAEQLEAARDRLSARPSGRLAAARLQRAAMRVRTPRNQVSVVIPSAGSLDEFAAPLIWGALDLIAEQTDVFVVVTNGRMTADGARICEQFGAQIIEVSSAGGFNFSRAINVGVAATSTARVLLLNDDIQGPASPDWLRWWLTQPAPLSSVALKWPNGRTCYAGIMWGAAGEMPDHLCAGTDPATLPPEPPTIALTGAALLVSRAVFDQVGGFCEELPLNYNDIDFCIQALRLGYRPRQLNKLVLTHRESASRGHTPPTVADYHVFERRCADQLAREGVHISAAVAIEAAGLAPSSAGTLALPADEHPGTRT